MVDISELSSKFVNIKKHKHKLIVMKIKLDELLDDR